MEALYEQKTKKKSLTSVQDKGRLVNIEREPVCHECHANNSMKEQMGLGKIAFLYPPAGTQYEGMGKEIAFSVPSAMDVFTHAGEYLDYDIKKLCFEGPEVQLMRDSIGHMAIVTTSLAVHAALENNGVFPDLIAGSSLGEYTALIAAKAVTFSQMVQLLSAREKHMKATVQDRQCCMRLIIGLDIKVVEDAVHKAAAAGLVGISNYNAPGQIVIAGETPAVKVACQYCREAGAKRIGLIVSSVPSHTLLLAGVAPALRKELEKISIEVPIYPIVSNVSATVMEDVVEAMVQHLTQPVRWVESIQYMMANGVDLFIEVGPKATLTGLVREISGDVSAMHVEDSATLKAAVDFVRHSRRL